MPRACPEQRVAQLAAQRACSIRKTARHTILFPAPPGSVANYRKQESLDSQVIDFPIHDFRILPRKGNFATERAACNGSAPAGASPVIVLPQKGGVVIPDSGFG